MHSSKSYKIISSKRKRDRNTTEKKKTETNDRTSPCCSVETSLSPTMYCSGSVSSFARPGPSSGIRRNSYYRAGRQFNPAQDQPSLVIDLSEPRSIRRSPSRMRLGQKAQRVRRAVPWSCHWEEETSMRITRSLCVWTVFGVAFTSTYTGEDRPGVQRCKPNRPVERNKLRSGCLFRIFFFSNREEYLQKHFEFIRI